MWANRALWRFTEEIAVGLLPLVGFVLLPPALEGGDSRQFVCLWRELSPERVHLCPVQFRPGEDGRYSGQYIEKNDLRLSCL